MAENVVRFAIKPTSFPTAAMASLDGLQPSFGANKAARTAED
jgi:hypothetical protein